MSKVIIVKSLLYEIKKTFSQSEANTILDLLYSLEKHPKKGKVLSSIGGVIIKEIKYKNMRFYFITDGFLLKVTTADALTTLLIKFVRMSTKKEQQKTINQIKHKLKSLGFDSF